MAQRLARKNCPHCITEEPVDPLVRKALSVPKHEVFYHGTGCEHCNNTGFRGRVAIYELLKITDTVRKCILEKKTTLQIRDAALEEGMVPLTENALTSARNKTISLAEAYRIRIQ
jgi:type IV pilus assembly protein PilB